MDIKSQKPLDGVQTALERLQRNLASYKPFLPEVWAETAPDASPVTEERTKEDLEILLDHLEAHKHQLREHPYSVDLHVRLAKNYIMLGYPDLATGTAYKALMLVDAVEDDSNEYHEEALEDMRHTISGISGRGRYQMLRCCLDPEADELESFEPYKESRVSIPLEATASEVLPWTTYAYGQDATQTLILSLVLCRCFKSAYEQCNTAIQKYSNEELPVDLSEPFVFLEQMIVDEVKQHFRTLKREMPWNGEDVDVELLPEVTYVRREPYPWNEHEPDRYSAEAVEFLNEEMVRVAPKFEVKVTELPDLAGHAGSNTVKQLGVFAKEDLEPGEVVLREKSLLTANNKMDALSCDACNVGLPELTAESRAQWEATGKTITECQECFDCIFCSEECEALAQESYHPAVCGMGLDQISKDVDKTQASDALYQLLLLRAIAMAETQDVHPLDLKEVKYIWGDYHGLNVEEQYDPANVSAHNGFFNYPAHPFRNLPTTLPFSFSANVVLPFHMMEKMDINPFENWERYDVWVFNTLYAKFRGTASAKHNERSGVPEIAAVHPMWCLANHDCDPNVSWEWSGDIELKVREKRVKWKADDGAERPEAVDNRPGGIKKGQEIHMHYCDIDLPVTERREWAMGALGGLCMCERCKWEAAHQG